MKIRTHLDVIEIPGEELEDILREAVKAKYGRVIDHITWVNVTDKRTISSATESKLVNLNATLKPESK